MVYIGRYSKMYLQCRFYTEYSVKEWTPVMVSRVAPCRQAFWKWRKYCPGLDFRLPMTIVMASASYSLLGGNRCSARVISVRNNFGTNRWTSAPNVNFDTEFHWNVNFRFCWFQIETFILQFHSLIFSLYQASTVRNDVRGRGLTRTGIERRRGRPGQKLLKSFWSSEDENDEDVDLLVPVLARIF